jgi:signal transduction histidine kinase
VSPEQLSDITRIRAAQQHLLGLINDILNFAKIEAGHVQFDIADVPIASLLTSLESLVGPDAAAKGLAFEWTTCDGDGGAPLAVRADPERLRQVLLNLVSNAVKFTPSGGAVRISCELTPGQPRPNVAIRVTDTGRGIPAERLTSVFDPFVQVDRHLTTASQQGVGLGLAISRDLARAMGGDLEARSDEGHGSVFSVTMPMA